MFSSAFPLAALFAFINNLVEVRRDARCEFLPSKLGLDRAENFFPFFSEK